MSKKPFWWPQRTDKEWCDRIREDYPEDTDGMSDDSIRDVYAEGCEFEDLWDHLGDAREDYYHLATAFLKLVEETGKKPEDFE